jgi:RNA polymerase sigma-70 factor (ECF subfamily)
MTAESENQMESRMTESDAILRAREGDSLGFEYLYNSHRKHVYSVCLRILKNSADAEDLTQQTFLQVFRKLGTFRGESGFSTWLHRVTINVVLMHLRRKKPTEARTEDLDSVATNTEASHELAADDASLLGAIDRLTLRRALHKLPVGYRKYFLLRRFCNARQGVPNRSCTRPAGGCGICYKVNRGGASPTLSLPEIANCPECFGCSGGIVLGRLQVRSHGLSAIREQNCKANLHLDRCESNAQHTPIVVTGEDPRPTRPGH